MQDSRLAGVKVLAFDCDGVLFDTEEANRAYYNAILAYFKRPPMDEQAFAYSQMHTADQAIAYLFPDPDEYRMAQECRKKHGYFPYIPLMKMARGLKDYLHEWKKRFKLAVVTNRTDTMENVLAVHGLGDNFDMVVTAMDVSCPKPHPEALLKVAERFSVLTGEILYVGDSSVDQEAAQRAGVIFVAYDNPGLEADFYVAGMAELNLLLESRDVRDVSSG